MGNLIQMITNTEQDNFRKKKILWIQHLRSNTSGRCFTSMVLVSQLLVKMFYKKIILVQKFDLRHIFSFSEDICLDVLARKRKSNQFFAAIAVAAAIDPILNVYTV